MFTVQTTVEIELTVCITLGKSQVLFVTLSRNQESVRTSLTIVILTISITVLDWSGNWSTSKIIRGQKIVDLTFRTRDNLD